MLSPPAVVAFLWYWRKNKGRRSWRRFKGARSQNNLQDWNDFFCCLFFDLKEWKRFPRPKLINNQFCFSAAQLKGIQEIKIKRDFSLLKPRRHEHLLIFAVGTSRSQTRRGDKPKPVLTTPNNFQELSLARIILIPVLLAGGFQGTRAAQQFFRPH